MARPVVWLLVAAGAALFAAGCGGSKAYALSPTRACLEKQPGVRVGSRVDFVASTALGGALDVRLPRNQVTIAFALDGAEAKRLLRAYRRFRGRNIGIGDVLRPQRNAVLLWASHPDDHDLAKVIGCLE
jgi:hypothetical protein